MSITKWRPKVSTGLDRFFDSFRKDEFPAWSRLNFASEDSTLPAVNVKETNDDFRLEVAAPGLQKKDFNVSVENGVITIYGERKNQEERNDNGYTRKEFSYQSFQRSFNLPDSVDETKINAKYNDGILHLSLPKRHHSKTKQAKIIKVS